MSENSDFSLESKREVELMGLDSELKEKSMEYMATLSKLKYSYHFEWLGRPIIQFPQDIVAIQEIIWASKPDLIIETGIAHGGSLVLSASLLALLDLMDLEEGIQIGPPRKVLGVDLEIREQNRVAIETHPLSKRIEMIEGSSTDKDVFAKVQNIANRYGKVMVCLDSNHTHAHVLEELRLYSKVVTSGQYLVVFDTMIEKFPTGFYLNRDWDRGNNPMTAVNEFLKNNIDFKNQINIENKLLITSALGGYLLKE
jgi:cephalosporin hydroxylase